MSDIEQRTVKVLVGEIEVSYKDWKHFNDLIPFDKRKEFVNNIMNDMLKQLLYKNPELFSEYARKGAQQPS